MLKLIYIIGVISFLTGGNRCFSQDYQWAKNIGSLDNDGSNDVTIDNMGNVYIIGAFSDTADFDPSSGILNLISNGSADIFLAKYDNNGNFLWAKSIGNENDDMVSCIATDNSGNIYITGVFYGSVDFDPNAGIANLTSVGSADIFFAKYDNNGNYLWAKNIGGTNIDEGKSIAIDYIGNVYLSGEFFGIADFDPGIGIASLSSVGSADIFFAKYDNNGNYLWANNIGSTDEDLGYSIKIDVSGNVLITGGYRNTADFDPSIGVVNHTSFGNYDIFLAKYDNDGNYIWAKSIGSNNSDISTSIAVDNIGNVYITGYFSNTTDFDPDSGTANLISDGAWDIFFAKYDNNGNYFWAKNIGSTGSEVGNDIKVDGIGNIYITGWFEGTPDFNPDIGIANLTAIGSWDIFFAKFDINGNYFWAKNIGGIGGYVSNAIVIDSFSSVYITGYFSNTADFDPDLGTANLTSVGSDDIFFSKYSQINLIENSETSLIESLFIYPNPAYNKLYVKIPKFNIILVTINIYDMQGKQLIQVTGKQNETAIDVSGLEKGVYGVRISGNGLICNERFIKVE